MFCTPEGLTYNIPMSHSQYVTVKNPSERKLLRQFLDTLEVKPNTTVYRFCAVTSKRKAIRAGSMFCYSIPKKHIH